jgi:hypothetical protein
VKNINKARPGDMFQKTKWDYKTYIALRFSIFCMMFNLDRLVLLRTLRL